MLHPIRTLDARFVPSSADFDRAGANLSALSIVLPGTEQLCLSGILEKVRDDCMWKLRSESKPWKTVVDCSRSSGTDDLRQETYQEVLPSHMACSLEVGAQVQGLALISKQTVLICRVGVMAKIPRPDLPVMHGENGWYRKNRDHKSPLHHWDQ